jgi:pimeloyl-ACP methyl ester carboxylesterase
MAKIETREVVVGGVRSFVRTSGASIGREAIVFVHGNPGSSEDWVDLLPRAGELTRAVAPDMPGYGQADRPKDFQYTVEGYARHLAGTLEQLGIEHAHLVLHDFGGPWGLTWAGAHPAAVKSLTLVNMGLLRGYTWHKYAKIWRTPVLGELFQLTATRGMFRMLLDHENPKPFPRAFVDRMFNDLNGGTKRAILKLYRATPDLDAMSRDLADKLRPLRLPALVVWGTGDSFLPSHYASEQADVFPDVEVHLMEGCGHWPFIDEPERVASLMLPFWRKQLGASAPTQEHAS